MARKRRSHWGTYTYDRAKKKGRIRYRVKTPEGSERRSKVVYGTKADVEAELARLESIHHDGTYSPTVREIYETEYLPRQETLVADGELASWTFANMRWTANSLVLPRWGDVSVRDVRALDVQKWVLTMTRTRAKRALVIMRKLFTYAVRYEYVTQNPMLVTYDLPPKSTTRSHDAGSWSTAELCDLWRAFYGHALEPQVLLCAFGSCRTGEALAVRGSDVSEIAGLPSPIAVVDISKEVDGFGNCVDRVKTAESSRPVVLAGDPALRLLELARRAGSNLLTRGTNGANMTQGNFRKRFRQVLDESDVTTHLPRAMRKSWQTMMRWTLHLDRVYVEPLMGHKMQSVTARHYDRPDVERLAAIVADHYAENPFADGTVASARGDG